jgi:hypothetical protein
MGIKVTNSQLNSIDIIDCTGPVVNIFDSTSYLPDYLEKINNTVNTIVKKQQ